MWGPTTSALCKPLGLGVLTDYFARRAKFNKLMGVKGGAVQAPRPSGPAAPLHTAMDRECAEHGTAPRTRSWLLHLCWHLYTT